MLLSSMPRSCTSRLAWLNRTPIAVASGRINQNYNLYNVRTLCLNCFKELAVTKQISALPVSTSEPTPVKPDLVGSPSKKHSCEHFVIVSSCCLIEHGLLLYVSRIFIPCYMQYFLSGPTPVKPAYLVLHEGCLMM